LRKLPAGTPAVPGGLLVDFGFDDVFSRYDEAGGGKSFWGAIADYWRAMMRWVY
jgi:hypothetical protein